MLLNPKGITELSFHPADPDLAEEKPIPSAPSGTGAGAAKNLFCSRPQGKCAYGP